MHLVDSTSNRISQVGQVINDMASGVFRIVALRRQSFFFALESLNHLFLARLLAGRFGLASPFLIRVAAIIGLVEARAFEDNGRPGSEQAAEFHCLTLGALLLDRCRDSLKQLELVATGITEIVVSRHDKGALAVAS